MIGLMYEREISMKKLVMISIVFVYVAICCFAGQNYTPIPTPQRPPGKYVVDMNNLWGAVGSFDQLLKGSELIIDGTIKEILPSYRTNPPSPTSLETCSIVSINKVIWGNLPNNQKTVAMAEPGGNSGGYEVIAKQHPLAKLGERYIFFLKSYPLTNAVNNTGMPLYRTVGSWAGKVQINEKEIAQFLPDAVAELHSFDGKNVDSFISIVKERKSRFLDSPPVSPTGPDYLEYSNSGKPLPPIGVPTRYTIP
jgi:hypothetical protein